MPNNDLDIIQTNIEKKAIDRLKKKKPNMKISGKKIKDLQRLIIAKSKTKQ